MTETQTVHIEKIASGHAVAIVGAERFEARYDATLRRWRVLTAEGERFSVSAKLHSIGKVFGSPRALVPGAPPRPELPPAVVIEDPDALRQAQRILASMREFGFSSYWQSHQERYGCETGHTHCVAGDPIYHTIGEVAGVEASRAETIEAIEAVVAGRDAELPPRMSGLTAAVKIVAEALAAGKQFAHGEFGRVKIEGPNLPPDWDGCEVVQ